MIFNDKKIVLVCVLFILSSHSNDLMNQTRKERILGGRVCDNEPHSYLISLQNKWGRHVCGGTLLNQNWVLTAAHCLRNKTHSVIAGKGTAGEQIRGIKKLYRHPSYDFVANDIGVLLVDKPFDKSQFISFIEIPSKEITATVKEFCPVALVMGWGVLTASSRIASPTLQCVDLPVLSKEECMRYYKPHVQIFTRTMCTLSKEYKDACQGDSGGPLICKERGLQLGIISFGRECGDPYSPGVYTRVDKYAEFILRTIRSSHSKKEHPIIITINLFLTLYILLY